MRRSRSTTAASANPPFRPISRYRAASLRNSWAARLLASIASGLVVVVLTILGFGLVEQGRLNLDNLAAAHGTGLELDRNAWHSAPTVVYGLMDRWYGHPSIYQPPAIANTDIIFFDVSGKTQADLINGLNHSNICVTYGPCLVDPAVPSGIAWGLEGDFGTQAYYYCYSPRTTTLDFRHRVILPRWSPPSDGSVPRTLVEKWNDLAKTIYVHEAGHVVVAEQDIADMNAQAQALATCDAVFSFWADPHVWDKLSADQNAYHARLRADCRPEIGCIPYGWEGW
ncbi:MAG: DUF922 domain-containing protein [Chloroflexi bacterium]|nr:MAG: DUF922 domain-containing protein [Chloroflexota bacterium]